MEEKRSCCCKTLPKALWWLLALLGLPLLYFFMFNAAKDPIEEDLTQRVKSALIDKDMSWVTVDVDERGRDVWLGGTAPDSDAGAEALALVKSVQGVRIADGEFTEYVATQDMDLAVSFKDGKILLKGTVANQAEADAIVQAAVQRVGEENVVNNLSVSKNVKASGWLGKLSGLMALGVENGDISVSSEGIKVSGVVDSEDKQKNILETAKNLLGEFNIPVLDGLSVVIPEPVEPEPEPESMAKAETIVVEPEPTEKEKAMLACQSKLNEMMEGKSIHFSTNAAVIKQESYPLLNEIAGVMAECSDAISGGVSINGHTDSRGDDAYNMSLSVRRAEAVKNYLANHQVNKDLMKAVGHGETSPIASNDTAEGRAQNRRITFIIIKE